MQMRMHSFSFGWILIVSLVVSWSYAFYCRKNEIPPEPIDQQLESIDGITFEGPRASEWVYVRNEFVRRHPRCEACGSGYQLNVHHIKPFHLYPELELDEGNLITLCREHHFRIGHDPDGKGPAKPNWSLSNPNVRSDAASMRRAKQ
jgi:5-methylcytosine-specific restriction endonuclease McrA